MPKNMNEKEAVQYFLNWIKDNMEYDYSVYESSIEPYYDKLYENEEYTIAKNNTVYGLSTYDHIILNPKLMKENQIIY